MLFATNQYGIGSGLNIVLSGYPQLSDGISGALLSTGLMMIIHHPYDFPSKTSQIILLRPERQNFIAVNPIITTCASDVLDLAIHERKCYQPGDWDGEVYLKSACELDCLAKGIYEGCGCHPYNLPMLAGRKIRKCKVSDAACFSRNFRKMRCFVESFTGDAKTDQKQPKTNYVIVDILYPVSAIK